jgi:hypothetical protein
MAVQRLNIQQNSLTGIVIQPEYCRADLHTYAAAYARANINIYAQPYPLPFKGEIVRLAARNVNYLG